MRSKRSRFSACLRAGLAVLMLPGVSGPLVAAPAIRGSIAGRILDKQTGEPLLGVGIRANAVTASERLTEVKTNRDGSFSITNAPASVYTFTLRYQGGDYRVVERLDARAGMTFLMEACFELDRARRRASVSHGTCTPTILEEAKVATLSPHRFMRAQDSPEPTSHPDSKSTVADPPGPIAIDHEPLSCLVANQFPVVDADILPRSQVQVARVYFRSSQHPTFYYVEMKGTEQGFEAILPKPLPETKQIVYYIEVLDRSFENARTEDHGPQVTEKDECKRKQRGAYVPTNPEIVVGATRAGASAIPPGFTASGITGFISASGAVTGGAGTTNLVLIISGAGAAAVGVVLASGDEDEASPPKK